MGERIDFIGQHLYRKLISYNLSEKANPHGLAFFVLDLLLFGAQKLLGRYKGLLIHIGMGMKAKYIKSPAC